MTTAWRACLASMDSRKRERLPTELDTLGKRLRWCRICRRYFLTLFARYTGFRKEWITQWERGEKDITTLQLRRWAYYLQLNDAGLEWLITGEGEPPVKPLTPAQRIMAEVDISPETRLRKLRRELGPLPKLRG